MRIYGIIDQNNCIIDVSGSEKATKQYATRNGYTKIGYRVQYHAFISHEKIGNKWVKVTN